jgi:thiopurine S-methyltransferase
MRHSIYGASYWHSNWAAGGGAFNVGRTDSLIAARWPALGVRPGSRVLVPLAGKSPDMAWLGSHGFDVVGVEISPIPCEAFFTERGIAVERAPAGSFVQWRGGGVTILQGDFFDLNGIFGAALDRGALVAFPKECRLRYAEHLRGQLRPEAPVLLVTIEYDARRRVGPPFPVFPDEVRQLFPAAVEHSRRPLRRARWATVGGAEAVLWVSHIVHDGPPSTARPADS